jgi:GT2 family glycosyltransferase
LYRQKLPWWSEVIFVCDTIKDDTLELIHNHPLAKKWEVLEIKKPGRGLAEGYNLGWRAARSNFVFFMHSDCYPADDDAMIRQVQWLEKDDSLAVQPLVDIPQGDWDAMSFWDRVTSSQFRHAKPNNALMGKFDLIRRDALEKIGGFDEKCFFSAAEDADIMEMLLSMGRVASADVMVIHAHKHPPASKFVSVLRKHAQYGEGTGAMLRKHGLAWALARRAFPVTAVNALKLILLIGIFVPYWPVSVGSIVLMLSLAIYYGRWAMLSRDWRVVLIPFAVSLMFSVYALSMVKGFILGRQTFGYHKRTK